MSAAEPVPSVSASAKRAAVREAQVAGGVEDAILWLEDILRTGLIAARSQSYAYWDAQAARLVDAKAPGLARRVRALPQILAGQEWQEHMLPALSRLYLLLLAYTHQDDLALEARADLRSAIGWTVDQAALLQTTGQVDDWQVLGLRQVQEEQLLVRRTWLQARSNGALAMLLEYHANPQVKMPPSLFQVGQCVAGEVVFFPSSVAQRALLKADAHLNQFAPSLPAGHTSCLAWMTHFGTQMARNPWLERSAAVLQQMLVVQRQQRWYLRDSTGALLLLSSQAPIWHLLALAGGDALSLFGEWEQDCFLPLAYWQNGWQALPEGAA